MSKLKVFDKTKANLNSFPELKTPQLISRMNLSYNSIPTIPKVTNFTSLRFLDLSHNQITDASPLSDIQTLEDLDVSFNNLLSVDFVSMLKRLDSFNAANNKIPDVNVKFPQSLHQLDLSNNKFISFEFVQSCLPSQIIDLSLSGNPVNEFSDLRFFSVLEELKNLNIGFSQKYRGIKLREFVKYLCPLLEKFDERDITNVDGNLISDDIDDLLIDGSSQRLIQFLSDETEDSMSDIRKEISDIKQQILQISQMIYAHDKAISFLWKKASEE